MTAAPNPLLSICIPTYNRARFLKQTLDCIVSQQIFIETDLIEVVISNNSSTDDTESLALDFQKSFPCKIRYVCTQETVHSTVNFANVLLHAQGKLCKLHNDSISILPGFMEAAISLIQSNFDEKNIIFFLDGNTKCPDAASLCASMDDFVSHASFYMTWIGGFSLWKKDIPNYAEYFTKSGHHFAQTEILLALLAHGRRIFVYNTKFGEEHPGVTKQVTTKFLEDVYIGEYVPLLKRQVDNGLLDPSVCDREVTRLIIFYYIRYYYRLQQKFQLSFVKDFSFLRKYVQAYKYYIILCLYPLYFCMNTYIGSAKLRMPVSLLRKILHG